MKQIDADFADYVRARQHRLLRAAYLVCGDAHRAEDLLQQAFEKLALRWETIKHGQPDAYVRRILYRDAVSSWRRTRREHLTVAPPEPDTAGPAGQIGLDEGIGDRIDLQAAVGTVKSQTHVALANLRELVPHLAPALSQKDLS